MSPRPMRRKRQRRPPKRRVLIVCEGEKTERHYFDQFKRDSFVTERFAVTVKKGKGGSRQGIAHYAVKLKQSSDTQYDELWCVMDVEGPEQRAALEEAVILLQNSGFQLCLSNPAFEVWFLAHFKRTSTSFLHADAVIEILDKHWQRHFNSPYRKNCPEAYRRLHSRLPTAVENARNVREQDHNLNDSTADCNSSTEMYRLVEHFRRNVA